MGLLSGRPVSTPIVKKGKVVDYYEGWIGEREFPLDMAGFAFTVKLLKKASKEDNVAMPYSNTDQENGFLKLLNVTMKDFQPLAKQCTEVKRKIILMSGSCHIRNVLIGFECRNCCRTLDVYLLFAI